MELTDQDALIVVDVQNDFCHGSLAVEGANDIIPLINKLIGKVAVRVLTRDFHPANHFSFSKNPKFMDKSWPPHCVQGTCGVDLHNDLIVAGATEILKGQDPETEEYSGFANPELLKFLNSKPAITRLIIVGLATDYCVYATAIAAKEQTEYEVVVIDDACRAVDIPAGSADIKREEMREAGVQLIDSKEISNLDTE